MKEVFGQTFQDNAWGSAESVSGPGSTRARAAQFLPDLLDLLTDLKVATLLDAPCGDFNWAAPIAGAVDRYIGVDIVPELVECLRRDHSTDTCTFLCADLAHDDLPHADLILCRDCLVHFSFQDIGRAVNNMRRSGAQYLLTTTFVDRDGNADIATGGWRVLNLQAAPFDFPPPLRVIDERCLHSGGIYADKRLALWDLADVPRLEFPT